MRTASMIAFLCGITWMLVSAETFYSAVDHDDNLFSLACGELGVFFVGAAILLSGSTK